MTTIDWNLVRRCLVTGGFTEKEAVEAVAIIADFSRQSQVEKVGMLATKDDVKEFERRLTVRFALMRLLSTIAVAIAIMWLL